MTMTTMTTADPTRTARNVRRRLARTYAEPGRRFARNVSSECVARAREAPNLLTYIDIYARTSRSVTDAVNRGEWPTRKEQRRREALREALFTPWQTDGSVWWRSWRSDPAPVVLVEFLRTEKNPVLTNLALASRAGRRILRVLCEEIGVASDEADAVANAIVDDVVQVTLDRLVEEETIERDRWRVRAACGASSGPGWDEQLLGWRGPEGSLDDGLSLGDAWIAGRLGDAFAERARREAECTVEA